MNIKYDWIKMVVYLVIMGLVVTACAPQTPAESPQDPATAPADPSQPSGEDEKNPFSPPADGDEDLERRDLELDQQELMIMESYPVQISLHIAGNLSTPCHQLRVKIPAANEEGEIYIEVYSVVHPEEVCPQVLEPFEENIPVGTFGEQGYTFFVNGEKVGEY